MLLVGLFSGWARNVREFTIWQLCAWKCQILYSLREGRESEGVQFWACWDLDMLKAVKVMGAKSTSMRQSVLMAKRKMAMRSRAYREW